jgi:hypothetical protein
MGKLFVAQNGICEEFFSSGVKNREVPFPLHVLVSPKEGLSSRHASFILNVDWGGVFVFTDQPLAEGCVVFIYFFIPPNSKVLIDFVGLVLRSKSRDQKHPGMFIKFIDFGQQGMNNLVAYLEEQKHLVDQLQ